MLAHFGVESISLNSYNDSKLAPRSQEEVAAHVENLKSIVDTLGYDMGVIFRDEGEPGAVRREGNPRDAPNPLPGQVVHHSP